MKFIYNKKNKNKYKNMLKNKNFFLQNKVLYLDTCNTFKKIKNIKQ